MWTPFAAGKPALPAETVRTLVELAWCDGLRTGLVAGFLLGAIVGVVCTVLVSRAKERT